ncbi:hypothetical protein SBF1_1300004 [Candidatus Desulfosporosinus infrequens]|uniref:Uncharacterized protein n=1 Tax=Candidatus Desulfosporosinus infrequens TaxID=2043169 RepID=A0A2U3K474_9FIRM|nr:hypothetical protein SBF1_1300004 [Candidatus Desulfosporosinus infrequens]
MGLYVFIGRKRGIIYCWRDLDAFIRLLRQLLEFALERK